MRMKKRLGVRFDLAALIINISHVLNVKSFQIQMIVKCSTILLQKFSRSYFDLIEQDVLIRLKRLVFRVMLKRWLSKTFNPLNDN